MGKSGVIIILIFLIGILLAFTEYWKQYAEEAGLSTFETITDSPK